MVDDENKPHTLRGLLKFQYPENGGIPIEEVEPASEIVKHFKTGANVLRLYLRRSPRMSGNRHEPPGRKI